MEILIFALFFLTLYGVGVPPPSQFFADNFKTAKQIRMKFSDF